jgi:hypothetical protein
MAQSRREVSEKANQQIDGEKSQISILWLVNGIQSFVEIPKGSTHNSAFFCNIIAPGVVDEICLHSRR